jgi:hypothetical protein
MIGKQRGITLTGALMGMILLGLVALFLAKLLPAYIEFYSVQKILKAMESNNETKGTVQEIRNAFDRRNTIEGVQALSGPDLDITKEAGEAIVTANWSTKVPIISNFSACLDFSVTTAK